jgi:hypothetical protein
VPAAKKYLLVISEIPLRIAETWIVRLRRVSKWPAANRKIAAGAEFPSTDETDFRAGRNRFE